MVSKIQNVSSEKATAVAAHAPTPAAAAKRTIRTASADAITNDGTVTLHLVADAVRATGTNPFESLAVTAVAANPEVLRLTDAVDATSESCEPAHTFLELISALETAAVSTGNVGPTKVRNGLMQVVYDAQDERADRLGMDRDGSEALARILVGEGNAKVLKPDATSGGQATEILHAQEWHAAVGTYFKGGDVNAFVQQVLRECYLLGNLDLQMYADRVKSYNELKKKIRDEATRARKVLADWHDAAKGDEKWVSAQQYETVKVDNAGIAVLPATWTQEDIDAAGGSATGELVDGSGSAGQGALNTVSAAQAFLAPGSGLDPKEQSRLTQIADASGKDIVKKYLDEVKGLIPKMNASDIEAFLLPILAKLKDGNHTGSIVHLFEVMSPAQTILVSSHGFVIRDEDDEPTLNAVTQMPNNDKNGLDPHSFDGREKEIFVDKQRDASIDLFGNEIAKDKYGKPLTAAEAKELWETFATRNRPQPPAAPTGPKLGEHHTGAQTGVDQTGNRANANPADPLLGTPKTVNTVEGMDAYVKGLEDAMNSVGDDQQLANVDLQNCLQHQQQTLQMMSNISKVMHDVTMAIIRNMNG